MKIKTLVAAVALVATGTAHAAITDYRAVHGGDLFVSIINPGATAAEDQSFHLNLNVLASSFDGNNLSQSWDLNMLSGGLYSSFNGQTDLRFTVAGANDDVNNFDATFGNYVTAQSAPTTVNGLTPVQDVSFLVQTQATLLDTAASGGDYALVNRGAQGFYSGTGTSTWGDNVYGINMSATIGNNLGFYFINPISLTESTVSQFAGSWSLSTAGILSYASVSAVPVPAAVWLFGSGLLGLAGIARRRKQS